MNYLVIHFKNEAIVVPADEYLQYNMVLYEADNIDSAQDMADAINLNLNT